MKDFDNWHIKVKWAWFQCWVGDSLLKNGVSSDSCQLFGEAGPQTDHQTWGAKVPTQGMLHFSKSLDFSFSDIQVPRNAKWVKYGPYNVALFLSEQFLEKRKRKMYSVIRVAGCI